MEKIMLAALCAASATLAAGTFETWNGAKVYGDANSSPQIHTGLGNDVDSTINYANPTVKFPASKTGNKVVASWSDFKQPSWYDGTVKFDGETTAKQLAGVHFKIQAEPGKYNFNICAVGPKDGTCPEKCEISTEEEGIKIIRAGSAPKAILKGRTLGFTGVSHATAGILNSLGQVVVRGAIEGATSTLNLAHLDAGIYLVRVNGKSTNFTNKILLK